MGNRNLYMREYRRNNPQIFKDIENRRSISRKSKKHEWYLKNKNKVKETHRLWYLKNINYCQKKSIKYAKDHPEIGLNNKKKQLTNIAILFNMNSRQFRYALICWSKSVRKRDDYTCQICGKRDEKSNIAHHILHRAKYPQLSLNLNNGITLCPICHKKSHFHVYNTYIKT